MPSTKLYGPSGAPGTAGLLALNTAGGALPVLPASMTIAGTTETVITNPSLASATQALVLSIPQNTIIDGKPFELVASGLLNHGASSTVTLKVYSGTSTTVGSDTSIATSGAITAFSGKSNFWVKLKLVFDSTSGKLNGTYQFMVNNVLVAEAALSAVVTGITATAGVAGAPAANFVMSVTFGTGNAANSITVNVFDINF